MFLKNFSVLPAAVGAVTLTLTCCWLVLKRKKDERVSANLHKQSVEYVRSLARNQKLCLVVDVGSSSIRCNAYTLSLGEGMKGPQQRLVPCSAQIHGNSLDDLGQADAKQILDSVAKAVTDCMRHLRQCGLSHHIACLGFACFGGTLLGVDATGEPVTPVYTYADRHPTTPDHAKNLRRTLEVQEDGLGLSYQRTGTPIHPAYAPAQLQRLKTEEPSVWAAVIHWQTLTSWLIACLTGKTTTPVSFCEASWTGMFDFRACQWDTEVLKLVGLQPDSLPSLCDPQTTVFSGLTSAFDALWPELTEVSIFPGIVDGAAANIGSKCVNNERLAVTIGTSAAMRVVLDSSVLANRQIPFGLWCYRLDGTKLLLGGALTDGGSLIQWMLDLFAQTEGARQEILKEAALIVKENDHGVTILPFLSGERSPGWNDEATASIFGLRRTTTPAELVAAGMEAVCLRLKAIGSLMEECIDLPKQIVASGAALHKSPTWCQMLADVMNVPVVSEEDIEATSQGVAMLISSYASINTERLSRDLPTGTTTNSPMMLPDLCPISIAQPSPTRFDKYLASTRKQDLYYHNIYKQLNADK